MKPMKDMLLKCLCCTRPALHHHDPDMAGEQERLDSLGSWTPSSSTCRFARGDGADDVTPQGGAGVAAASSQGAAAESDVNNASSPASSQEEEETVAALHDVSNAAMRRREDRLLSFAAGWPSSVAVRPDWLAEAGFFYVGRGDGVKCFCCDVHLERWEATDDPWVEHASWSPECEYLLREKGRGFVHRVQEELGEEEEESWVLGDAPVKEDEKEERSGAAVAANGQPCDQSALSASQPVIRSALEMGFERGLVERTVRSKEATATGGGRSYGSVQELVSDMLRAESRARAEERQMEKLLRRLQAEAEAALVFNVDVLAVDLGGECCVCLDHMLQGETIARLACLCVYHKSCIDAWAKVKPCCPEHPF